MDFRIFRPVILRLKKGDCEIVSRMAAFIFGPNGKEGLKALLSGRQKQYAKNRKERGLLNSEKQEEKKQKAKTNRNITGQTEKGCQLGQRLQILLEMPLTDPQEKEILKSAGLPVRYRDYLQLIAWNLYQKALSGDMAAIRELRGILEEGEAAKRKNRKAEACWPDTPPVVIIDDVR